MSGTTTIAESIEEDPLEFEEWDGISPFWHHCFAGSLAGVAEHVIVYPIDTVKTHIQCAACSITSASSPGLSSGSSLSAAKLLKNAETANSSARNKMSGGFFTTMRLIMSQPQSLSLSKINTKPTATSAGSIDQYVGFSRLWRGVHTIMIGCVPAHAFYFSSYEAVKYANLRQDGSLPYWAGLLAGGAAVIGHDIIMSPLDTIKQRLQLGHYSGLRQAALHMIKHEGTFSLYRSFPITLLTNIPYGSIMVSTNEICKDYLSNESGCHGAPPSLSVCLLSSSIGGLVASFTTTPLDRIKTMLQIQKLQPVVCERYGTCPNVTSKSNQMEWKQVIRQILRQEGIRGLFKGCLPRILSHTPAVAISWTTYETAKKWLAQSQEQR